MLPFARGFDISMGVKMAGTVLEDKISEAFHKRGYIVFTRKNHCDVLAVKPDMTLAYLVECKDYELSKKQQKLAVRELNRNYTHALELLINQEYSAVHPRGLHKTHSTLTTNVNFSVSFYLVQEN